MMYWKYACCYLFLFYLVLIESAIGLDVVSSIDLRAYMGTWYEIARYDNEFQKDCLASKAEYELKDEKSILVHNTCTLQSDPDKKSDVLGIGFIADPATNAKLKISFVPVFKYWGWFSGDYWIVSVDSNYQHALVGTPNYKYFWILARSPLVSEELYTSLIDLAVSKGFDKQKIKRSAVWK